MSEAEVVNVDGEAEPIDEILPARLQNRLQPISDPLEHFQKLSALLPQLRAASIKLTSPQDWVQMGDSVYFQGIGAERVAPMWGLALGEPIVEREDYPDGTYSYVVTGPVLSRLTGVVYRGIQGGRYSGEDFFERWSEPKPKYADWNKLTSEERRAWEQAHRLPPNPLDVRKAAVTNWQVRAVTMITGLRGLTPADLEKHGIKPKTRVQFGAGTQGGKVQATDADGELLIQVGSKKGQRVKDQSDAEVSSLMAWYQKQADDPAKAKYKAENEAWVEKLEREIERRARESA